MQFAELADSFFPGYSLLSCEQKQQFEASKPGKKFVKAINELRKSWPDTPLGTLGEILITAYNWCTSKPTPDATRNALVLEKKLDLITKIEKTDEYLQLKQELLKTLIGFALPDFPYFKSELQKAILEEAYSGQLLDIAAIVKSKDETDKQSIQKAFESFRSEFDKSTLKQKVGIVKISTKLLRVLPFLEIDKQDQLDHLDDDPKLLIQSLTELVLDQLKELLKNIDADWLEFNQKWAKKLAKTIYQYLVEPTIKLDYEDFFNRYKIAFEQSILSSLKIKSSKFNPDFSALNEMSSLAYLFQNSLMERGQNFINGMADAHSFIQSMGGGSQGDNLFLGIIDFYNCYRLAEQATEAKTILLSLFTPLKPLYEEYKEVAFYEKNIFLKIYRTLLPLLIITAVVILTCVLLAPLALPELALAVIIIPTLIIGLIIAAQSLRLKNAIYNFLRESWYGGPFLIPEFQVNDRMLSKDAFASREKAEKVRDFYIDEIRACNQLEAQLQQLEDRGVLTEQQIEEKKINLDKRYSLYLEWYDIHRNPKLGVNKLLPLVLARAGKEYKQLKKEVDTLNEVEIETFTTEVTTKLIKRFREKPENTAHFRPSFFKPIVEPRLESIEELIQTLTIN